VAGVLDAWLSERAKETSSEKASAKAKGSAGPAKDDQGNVWLIGNKITYVDLMFANWNGAASMFMQMSGKTKEDWDPETQFPRFWNWQSAMMARPSFQKAGSMQKVEDVHL
jgi:glutathione S-transferase